MGSENGIFEHEKVTYLGRRVFGIVKKRMCFTSKSPRVFSEIRARKREKKRTDRCFSEVAPKPSKCTK